MSSTQRQATITKILRRPGEAAAEIERLRISIVELEGMLRENLAVCEWCRAGELPPSEYVRERTDLIGQVEETGAMICPECFDKAMDAGREDVRRIR